jgi:hypothetical protein
MCQPGEAQQIDRIMLNFAKKYYEKHSDKFRVADTAYVLAFSLIMVPSSPITPRPRAAAHAARRNASPRHRGWACARTASLSPSSAFLRLPARCDLVRGLRVVSSTRMHTTRK